MAILMARNLLFTPCIPCMQKPLLVAASDCSNNQLLSSARRCCILQLHITQFLIGCTQPAPFMQTLSP